MTSTSDTILWFNAKCSKCRETLELLRGKGVEPVLRRYLDEKPTRAELDHLIDLLQISPHELLRANEASDQGLSRSSSRDAITAALILHPELLVRPILVRGERAVIARPPQRALELLDA